MEELAGRPAGFGENIRETFWGAKTSARFLASRPAGRPASVTGLRRFSYWLPIESAWHDYDQ